MDLGKSEYVLCSKGMHERLKELLRIITKDKGDPSRRCSSSLSLRRALWGWSPYSPNLSSCRASFWLPSQNR